MGSYQVFAAFGLFATCLVAGTAEVLGQQAWKAQMKLITANNQCGFDNEPFYWIREEPGKFGFYDSINRKELMWAPMKEDGSVNTSSMRGSRDNRTYKLVVPPGNRPRNFELVDLTWVCRMEVSPTGAVR